MATFVKFNAFTEALAEAKHNLGSNTLKVLLSNVAPVAATAAVKADVTEIAPGNGYVAGGSALTVTASSQAAGIYKLIANDLAFTAAGGAIGPFQYAVLYNDTAAADDLIGYWDYGSPLTLADTEVLTLDFAPANTVLQLS
jgi:hypothetical protein